MPKKPKNTHLKLVEKSWEDDITYMLSQISPEDRLQVAKTIGAALIDILARKMSSKELTAWGDKHIPEFRAGPCPALATDFEKNFAAALVEKRRSEFKGIRGGR